MQICRNEIINGENKKVQIFLFSGATPVLPSELNFAIYELSSPQKVITPVKIFPISSDMHPVDVFNDLAHGGDMVYPGQYVAKFQMPSDASLGRAKVKWFYKTDPSQPVYATFEEEFELLDFVDVYGSSGKPSVSISEVRTYLRDFPEFHVLIDNFLFSNNEIMKATEWAVDRFNVFNPPLGLYTTGNFPNKSLLILGASAWLFNMEANRQLIEQFTYQDGNIHHGITDKTQLYRTAADSFTSQFDTLAQELKTQLNINQIYDGTGEGVRFSSNRYYGRRSG